MRNKIKWLIVVLLIPVLFGFISSRYGPWWGLREQASAPTTPSNGVKIWTDSSNIPYCLNESGNNYRLDVYDPNDGLTDPTSIGTLTLGSGSIADSGNSLDIDSTYINIPDYFIHLGDTDTYGVFADDNFEFKAGGVSMLQLLEGATTDKVYLGYSGSTDIDVYLGPSEAVFVEGSSGNTTLKGNLILGDSDEAFSITSHDAGTIIMYDDSDDTTVTIGPVQDGTQTLSLSGTLDILSDTSVSSNALILSPQNIISTNAATYDGIYFDGSVLDPSGDDVELHAIHIDYSGITSTGANTYIGGIYVETPITDPASYTALGLHVVGGGNQHDFETSSTPATTFNAHNLAIDHSNMHSSAEIHALNVELETASPAGTVAGLAVYSEIDPIHQHIQAFSSPSQTEYAGRYTGSFTDGIDTYEVFVAKDNEIWFGSAASFNAVQIVLTTPATRDCLLEYYYYNDSSSWIQFYPSDSTGGFQNSGIIQFSPSAFTNWDSVGDPAGADGSAGYWISIKRTVAADPGTPTVTTLKTGTSVLYYWDENADLYLNDITAIGGDLILGTSAVAGTIASHDAGTITMYDDGDNTSVVIGPVADGTTRLDITGSLGISANLHVADYIYHGTDDSNTSWYFRTDRASLYAGGRTMVDAIETTQDLLYLGYDGSNDIDVSIGPDACVFIEGSSKKVTITTELEIPHANADVAPNETGEIFYDESEDQFVFYDTNSGELVADEVAFSPIKHISVVCDPGSWYDSDAEIFIMTIGDEAPSGIIIDEWKLSCNVDPDVEIDADLRYADAWIGLANAADIDEIDTTSGTSSEDTDSNINGGSAVANGKVMYVGFDADPEGTCTQMVFEVWFHAID